MTPDQARDLVAAFEGRRLTADYETYGLADGYQHIEHYVLLEIDQENPETGEPDVSTDPLEMPDKATADMIAAAPHMAAMIAGMHEEWGVSWDDDPSDSSRDWGFATRAAAERWEKANRHYGPGRGHAVRRYIIEPEEA